MTSFKTRAASAAAALLLLGLGACESGSTVAGPAAATADVVAAAPAIDNDDVYEATLRALFADKGVETFDAYCVSTGAEGDPSAALLGRFTGSKPAVVPVSDCDVNVAGTTYIPTGGQAQYFFVRTPVFTGRVATVEAGFQINGRLAEFFRCSLHPGAQGTYVVRECELVGAA